MPVRAAKDDLVHHPEVYDDVADVAVVGATHIERPGRVVPPQQDLAMVPAAVLVEVAGAVSRLSVLHVTGMEQQPIDLDLVPPCIQLTQHLELTSHRFRRRLLFLILYLLLCGFILPRQSLLLWVAELHQDMLRGRSARPREAVHVVLRIPRPLRQARPTLVLLAEEAMLFLHHPVPRFVPVAQQFGINGTAGLRELVYRSVDLALLIPMLLH